VFALAAWLDPGRPAVRLANSRCYRGPVVRGAGGWISCTSRSAP
jgi:hypothetical protein